MKKSSGSFDGEGRVARALDRTNQREVTPSAVEFCSSRLRGGVERRV